MSPIKNKKIHAREMSWWEKMDGYASYGFWLLLGKVQDTMDTWLYCANPKHISSKKRPTPGYAPVASGFEDFFIRRIYNLDNDPWARPITGPAGSGITVLERHPDKNGFAVQNGNQIPCVNLSSYNYLGFAELPDERKKPLMETLDRFGTATCSAPATGGYTQDHQRLEETVAQFLGVEAALVFGMGWGTNATALPCLVGEGSLIISDGANHASIVTGARATGATIRVFKHNDVEDLEKVVVKAICGGDPKRKAPWKKILIVVEGIYSMEGTSSPLAKIVEIKKKYNCYLYVDEAHSIGAYGPSGRGVCEQTGVPTSDIDILMGTFTKSFGAIGGYVAGSKRMVESVRRFSASSTFSPGLSPVCTTMTQTAFDIIMGNDGSDLGRRKVQQLSDNSNWMRNQLIKRGFAVLGDEDSPIIPIMCPNYNSLIAISRECLKRGVALVVVGYPATEVYSSRCRLCISAAHTRQQLEHALKVIDELGTELGLKSQVPATPSSDANPSKSAGLMATLRGIFASPLKLTGLLAAEDYSLLGLSTLGMGWLMQAPQPTSSKRSRRLDASGMLDIMP